MHPTADGPDPEARSVGAFQRICDVAVVSLIFFLLSSSPAPDVNEAHYWTKAKHFWDPGFCPSDSFLNSADAHWSFYLTLGQLTRWLPLESATWVGRWIIWSAMAVGWCSLARCFVGRSSGVWLTAALMVLTTRWCHLSGEWVVGGAEAKGLAFSAVFLALAAACRGRWGTAFLAGGIGAGFHVLVGGWTVLCLIAVAGYRWCLVERPSPTTANHFVHVAGGLVVGGLFSLAGLLPALALSTASPQDINEAANTIYVLHRLPHHLVFWAFQPIQIVAFSSLLVLWLITLAQIPTKSLSQKGADPLEARRFSNLFPGLGGEDQTPLGIGSKSNSLSSTSLSVATTTLIQLVHAALGLAAIGLGLSLMVLFDDRWDQVAIGLLRYYWFRTADVFLPIGVVLIGYRWVLNHENASDLHLHRASSPRSWLESPHRSGAILLMLLCLAWEGGRVFRNTVVDPRPNADKASLPSDRDRARTLAIYQHWRNVCHWIQTHTAHDALFLTPRSQQTFKWYGQRSEVVNWKDIPQDSRGLLDWQQRVLDCAPIWNSDYGVAVQDPVAIHELAQKYEVDYLLMTQYAYELQQRFGRQLPYRRVYPESAEQRSFYVVLAVDQWQVPPSIQPSNQPPSVQP